MNHKPFSNIDLSYRNSLKSDLSINKTELKKGHKKVTTVYEINDIN